MKVLLAAVGLMFCQLVWADAFNDGIAAYNRKDYATAIVKFKEAAKQRDAAAQKNVASMYEKGQGVAKDEKEAVRWYKMAAEGGDPVAQAKLGEMYANGRGVTKDDKEAVRWYKMAAEQRNAVAQYRLGVMYANGQGVAKDDNEAVRWFKMAAEQRNVAAQYGLGVMYMNGRGVTKDDKEAVRWLRMAAEQRNAAAQNALGVMYEDGRGVTKDDKEAVRWYELAAAQGNAKAKEALQRREAWLKTNEGKQYLAELDAKNKAAEAARKRAEAEATANLSKEFPFYAVVTCGMGGDHINIGACFFNKSGGTEIELTNGKEYGFFQVREIISGLVGQETREGLRIYLRENFDLKAQNAGENLVLGIKIFKTASNELVFQKKVSRFGVISVSN